MDVDLDEVLYGNPSFEDVAAFWRDDGEFHGEEYLIPAIKRWLLTPEERLKMYENDIDISDILNGRYLGSKSQFVCGLFDAWNQKLGFKAFSGG